MSEQDRLRRIAAKEAQEEFHLAPIKEHPYLKAAFEAALDQIHIRAAGSIVIVFGLTGVGKSTLMQRLVREIDRLSLMEAVQRSDFMANIGIQLPTPEGTRWNWRDVWEPMLEALMSPVPSSKLRVAGLTLHRDETGTLLIPPDKSATVLRLAVESILRQRRPWAVHIDEAQHLLLQPAGWTQRQFLEVFKSLANLSETPLVLYGSYELLRLSGLSAQLDRRCTWIHFESYPRSGEAKLYFISAIKSFIAQMPIPCFEPSREQCEEMLDRTGGCVGTLKEWLERGVYKAVVDGSHRLEWSHLAAKAPQASQSFWTELQEGLTMLKDRRGELAGRLIDVADSVPEAKPAKGQRPGRPKAERRVPIPA